jgi:hypothetical protein
MCLWKRREDRIETILVIIRRYGELGDDADKLQAVSTTQATRDGPRSCDWESDLASYLRRLCDFHNRRGLSRGGSMHVGRQVSSHLCGKRFKRFGRSIRDHTGLITFHERLFQHMWSARLGADTAKVCAVRSSNLLP